ncbi:MAG: DNA-binding protein WhiA [Culicoidibacterales bacterium]
MEQSKKMMKTEKKEQTFSQQVKEEVAANLSDISFSEATAFLAGFIKQNGSLTFNNMKLGVDVQTANAVVARRVYQLLRKYFPELIIEIVVRKTVKLKKQTLYVLRIRDDSKQFLANIHFFDGSNFLFEMPGAYKLEEKLLVSYVQGLFLGTGSLNNLQLSSYHLEISFAQIEHADGVMAALIPFNILFKKVQRRKAYLLYIKDSTMIGDFLAFLQAIKGRFAFEDVRISRDMMNSMNRLINCEVANEQKSQKATDQQIKNIRFVYAKLGADVFNEKEAAIIEMRLKYQDVSLVELADLLTVEKNMMISKSGLNHFFRKIAKKANDLLRAQ